MKGELIWSEFKIILMQPKRYECVEAFIECGGAVYLGNFLFILFFYDKIGTLGLKCSVVFTSGDLFRWNTFLMAKYLCTIENRIF